MFSSEDYLITKLIQNYFSFLFIYADFEKEIDDV